MAEDDLRFKEILFNPNAYFKRPIDVVKNVAYNFSNDQKIKILKRWEFDAREMEVAEEENMANNSATLLPEILDALHKLGSGVDKDSPPTKQGGE